MKTDTDRYEQVKMKGNKNNMKIKEKKKNIATGSRQEDFYVNFP